jgi:penicillin-binding protein 1C
MRAHIKATLRRLGAHRWTRAASAIAVALVLIAATGYGALRLSAARLAPLQLDAATQVSVTVLDRQDRLLRAFTTPEGRWRLPLEAKEVDPKYLAMLLAFEDRRFWRHGGADFIALARASAQMLRHGRIVSGGSTLTMQVARLPEGRHERTGSGKLHQILRALQIEEQMSKADILRHYLRLAPFGGNIEGVRAASLAYFGKEPRRLSTAEAALLVALPQSPEARRPDRHAEAARRARDRVLDRAVAAQVITATEAARAKQERVTHIRREFPKLAPHLAEAEVKREPGRTVHRVTIDRDIQRSLEQLATEHTRALGQKLSAAVLAIDHATGEVVSYVGSAGYLDDSRQGAIDMVKAIRSPGSTLKPIIYGLAFEAGIAHPETLIEDRPVRFGTYSPKNFDDDFHGTVTIREALDQSLNIPAVKVLNVLGPARLVSRVRRLRMVTALPAKTQPTLAIALGGIGMRMQDLAMLYASLANGGEAVQLKLRRDARQRVALSPRLRDGGKTRRLLTPVAAWYVADILKDAPPPASFKGGRIAYKTGTSYGYRDAWAIGYDGRHTIAVWVGRPDGAATANLTGRTAAAPILFDAFARITERRVALPPPPPGVVVASGADLPPPLKRFREAGDEPAALAGKFLEPNVAIAFPPDRAELDVEEQDGGPVVLKAEGGALPLTWLVDGAPIPSDPHRREVAWTPAGQGFVKFSVIDAKGRVDRVTVRLK